jgi:hypothetical protein
MKNEMGGACSVHGKDEQYIHLEWTRQLGRPRRRWEYNIHMDGEEIER